MYTFLPFLELTTYGILTLLHVFIQRSYSRAIYLHTLQQSHTALQPYRNKRKEIVRIRKTGSNESTSKLKGDSFSNGLSTPLKKKNKLIIAITLDSNYRDFRLDFVDRAFDFSLEAFGFACLQVISDEAVEQSLYEDKEREVERNYKEINEHH